MSIKLTKGHKTGKINFTINGNKYSLFLVHNCQLLEGSPVLQLSRKDKHGNYQDCCMRDISDIARGMIASMEIRDEELGL